MTQIPWLDQAWYKNPVVASFLPTTGFSILKIVGGFINERLEKTRAGKKTEGELADTEGVKHKDMLARFLEVTSANPSIPKW